MSTTLDVQMMSSHAIWHDLFAFPRLPARAVCLLYVIMVAEHANAHTFLLTKLHVKALQLAQFMY